MTATAEAASTRRPEVADKIRSASLRFERLAYDNRPDWEVDCVAAADIATNDRLLVLRWNDEWDEYETAEIKFSDRGPGANPVHTVSVEGDIDWDEVMERVESDLRMSL